ncbi:hypothetical protein A2U01_0053543, partial [Trifolium medium]|nr:hypothetical protein [Trifolium medium]
EEDVSGGCCRGPVVSPRGRTIIAPPRTQISLQRFNSEILSLQQFVGVIESGDDCCHVRVGRLSDRQGLIHRFFQRGLWLFSRSALRKKQYFIFILGKGRSFFSIFGITGVVYRYLIVIALERREDGVVLPRGRADDGVLFAVDMVV